MDKKNFHIGQTIQFGSEEQLSKSWVPSMYANSIATIVNIFEETLLCKTFDDDVWYVHFEHVGVADNMKMPDKETLFDFLNS